MEVGGLSLYCLHNKYNTPVLKGVLGKSKLGCKQFADHLMIWGNFGVIEVIDMTNYPSTIPPLEFPIKKTSIKELDENYTFDKLATLKPPKNEDSFEMYIYEPACPLRPDKDESAHITLKFGKVWGTYVHDLTFRRSMTYIIDQFLSSLSSVEL